jgi:peptidoglycan/LPS O-acetylase OafA/YrhL
VTRRFTTLDAMRGVAALGVLTLHVCKLFDLPYQPLNAHLGVDFFFLLSGLVVANAYEPRLRRGWPLGAFARKRLIRLYPMVLAGGGVGLCVLVMRQLLDHDLGWTGLILAAVPNLVLAPSPALLGFRAFGFPLNSPFWSLSAEMAVNLAYAAGARRLSDRRLGAALAAALAALAAMVIARGTVDLGYGWRDYPLALVRAAFPFLLGVALHRLQGRLRPGGAVNQLALLGLAAALLTPFPSGPAVDLLLITLGFPALLVAGLTARLPQPLAGLWRGLGELSYPLYAVHYPVVVVFAQVARSLRLHGLAQLGMALVCAAAAVALAGLVLVLFDRPVRAWLELRFPAKPLGEAERLALEQGVEAPADGGAVSRA